jgi:pSer/pThr/pTyr-binding forkhead associated (FHA) protein
LTALDVFISYSREDRAHARRFAERFTEEGLAVWWDAALHSGETFDEVIETALKTAKAVVVLWSPRSVASRWVRAEATLADRQNKLVPVTIEPCDRPIIFELTHTSDLSHWDGSTTDPAWRTLIKDVDRLVSRNGGASSAAAPAVPRTVAPSASTVQPAVPRAPQPAPRPAPRKLDNASFTRNPWSNSRQSNGHAEDEDTGDRTQIYTRSDGYIEEEQIHCLELTIGDRLEKRYVVTDGGLKIGRSAPADIILADSRVSRSHCQIDLADDELRVLDLNSTNGTFVDDERVMGTKALPVGSVLKVGSVSFKHEVRTRAEV